MDFTQLGIFISVLTLLSIESKSVNRQNQSATAVDEGVELGKTKIEQEYKSKGT